MLDAFERKMLYAFLAALFHRPDEQTVAAAGGVEEKTFETLFPGLSIPPEASLEELLAAYDALFVAGGDEAAAPPYGSVYLEKKPRGAGNSTKLVGALYASAGLNPEHAEEPADYLPAELEFLFYLCEGESQSLEKDHKTKPERWMASQADFFHNFFAPWAGPFCDRVAVAEKAHPFYRWAADLLKRFVELEKTRLKAVR
ncbi:MAG: hypothetical protein C0617_02065 [Desulfuromonas sp.]|uniref:TorD/DmsD family molecular chaperone n=1 Tax=Desulfuromonas sp. TaxID=892 RepID=UPI000CB3A984|nr:molecular chaperone TorD family protein [Desulfuromonas sp.]PLX86088.1 MAG: hypothetical protein C0617_02065 [Desulfuromonas sp.]